MREFLDRVRVDLDAATPGPWRSEWDDADKWHSITGAGHDLGGGLWMVCPEVATVEGGGDADARLIASAPDRLDRMERALRRALDRHKPVEVEPSDTICGACSNRLLNGRFMPVVDYPCPTVEAIKEELGDA